MRYKPIKGNLREQQGYLPANFAGFAGSVPTRRQAILKRQKIAWNDFLYSYENRGLWAISRSSDTGGILIARGTWVLGSLPRGAHWLKRKIWWQLGLATDTGIMDSTIYLVFPYLRRHRRQSIHAGERSYNILVC